MRHWLLLLASMASTPAAAAMRFESTPNTTATVNQRYRYDLDGVPSVSTDAGVPYTFSLTQAPQDMVLDNLSGELFWFPANAGPADVTLVVTDTGGQRAEQTFQVQVSTGVAPDFTAPSGLVVPLGNPVTLTLQADRGDAPRAWQLLAGPQGALLQPETGGLTWVPTAVGRGDLSVSLTNAFGTVSHDFSVEVSDLPLPFPTAVLNIAGSEYVPGSLVVLNASASDSGTGGPLSYLFDFGDGSPTRFGGQATTQQGYGEPGVYSAQVTVENVHLRRASAGARVLVRTDGGLTPPSARIGAELRGEVAPIEVRFTCDCAAGDAELISYVWEFGDGEISELRDPSHVYARAGGYNVKLKVLDAVGLEARDSFYLPVWTADGGLKPPFARARVRPRSTGDAPFSPELVAEFGDPDGIVVQRTWTLPDGRQVVDEDPALALTTLGSVRVLLTVRDNDGLESSDAIELRSTRDGQLPPLIRSKPNTAARVGEPFVYDEDSRASAVNGPYRWSVGLVVDAQRVGAPEGLKIDEATGAVTWTPAATQLGSQDVSLVVTNAAGTAVQRFTVQVSAPPSGCGCQSGAPLLFLCAASWLCRRRRTR